MNPNPRDESAGRAMPSLSKPAARPTGFENLNPNLSISSSGVGLECPTNLATDGANGIERENIARL
jgi:hypothetical protein